MHKKRRPGTPGNAAAAEAAWGAPRLENHTPDLEQKTIAISRQLQRTKSGAIYMAPETGCHASINPVRPPAQNPIATGSHASAANLKTRSPQGGRLKWRSP